jgi:hypothetical protein
MACRSGSDEISPFELLESPSDHGVRPVETGDLRGLERLSRESRQEPERHAVRDQRKEKDIELTGGDSVGDSRSSQTPPRSGSATWLNRTFEHWQGKAAYVRRRQRRGRQA